MQIRMRGWWWIRQGFEKRLPWSTYRYYIGIDMHKMKKHIKNVLVKGENRSGYLLRIRFGRYINDYMFITKKMVQGRRRPSPFKSLQLHVNHDYHSASLNANTHFSWNSVFDKILLGMFPSQSSWRHSHLYPKRDTNPWSWCWAA
jgi:hypothetical protein